MTCSELVFGGNVWCEINELNDLRKRKSVKGGNFRANFVITVQKIGNVAVCVKKTSILCLLDRKENFQIFSSGHWIIFKRKQGGKIKSKKNIHSFEGMGEIPGEKKTWETHNSRTIFGLNWIIGKKRKNKHKTSRRLHFHGNSKNAQK